MDNLVQRVLDGDQVAVVEFYHTYEKKILRYFQKKLPRNEDAQELMHDVFLEALDSLALFQGKSSLQTWLYSIAHNKVVDFYRKRKIASILLSQLPFLQLIAHEMHEPEFQFEKNKVRDRIEKTFHKLSANYHRVLSLHYEGGLPVKQIALEMNMSFKATESLLFRARQDFIRKYAKS